MTLLFCSMNSLEHNLLQGKIISRRHLENQVPPSIFGLFIKSEWIKYLFILYIKLFRVGAVSVCRSRTNFKSNIILNTNNIFQAGSFHESKLTSSDIKENEYPLAHRSRSEGGTAIRKEGHMGSGSRGAMQNVISLIRARRDAQRWEMKEISFCNEVPIQPPYIK